MLFPLFSFGFLELCEKVVQPLDRGLPVLAIRFEPLRGFGERLRLESAGTALGVVGTGNEAGALQHFEVLGDGGLSHGERLG
jgi:hypothetical protein